VRKVSQLRSGIEVALFETQSCTQTGLRFSSRRRAGHVDFAVWEFNWMGDR
jgi:hypothetical protein